MLIGPISLGYLLGLVVVVQAIPVAIVHRERIRVLSGLVKHTGNSSHDNNSTSLHPFNEAKRNTTDEILLDLESTDDMIDMVTGQKLGSRVQHTIMAIKPKDGKLPPGLEANLAADSSFTAGAGSDKRHGHGHHHHHHHHSRSGMRSAPGLGLIGALASALMGGGSIGGGAGISLGGGRILPMFGGGRLAMQKQDHRPIVMGGKDLETGEEVGLGQAHHAQVRADPLGAMLEEMAAAMAAVAEDEGEGEDEKRRPSSDDSEPDIADILGALMGGKLPEHTHAKEKQDSWNSDTTDAMKVSHEEGLMIMASEGGHEDGGSILRMRAAGMPPSPSSNIVHEVERLPDPSILSRHELPSHHHDLMEADATILTSDFGNRNPINQGRRSKQQQQQPHRHLLPHTMLIWAIIVTFSVAGIFVFWVMDSPRRWVRRGTAAMMMTGKGKSLTD